MVYTLDGRSVTKCPKCGRAIAFFRGTDKFISKERRYAADDHAEVEYPEHGKFEVLASEFVTKDA
jgi:hypothetical protein